MMRSAIIFIISLVINVLIFATVIEVTALHDRKSMNIPVKVNFIKFAEEPAEAPQAPAIKKAPAKKAKRLPAPKPKPVRKAAVKKEIVKRAVIEAKPEPVPKIVAEKAPLPTEPTVSEPEPVAETVKAAPPTPAAEPLPVAPHVEAASVEAPPMEAPMEEEAEEAVPGETTGDITMNLPVAEEGAGGGDIVPIESVTRYPRVTVPIAPVYPERARRAGSEGTVHVEVLIDSEGGIVSSKIVKSAGHGFDVSALDAVRRAEFKPALMGTRPVSVRVTIPIRFELE